MMAINSDVLKTARAIVIMLVIILKAKFDLQTTSAASFFQETSTGHHLTTLGRDWLMFCYLFEGGGKARRSAGERERKKKRERERERGEAAQN
jgi:hypothetical protein